MSINAFQNKCLRTSASSLNPWLAAQDLADSVNDMTKGNDWFLVANDFASYMDAQDQVDALYKDQTEWTRRSIKMTATSGFFSSDRTIRQYADEIWGVVPVKQA